MMTIKTNVDLRAAFEGREVKAAPPQVGEVPERIANHAPRMDLRPEGAMKASADAVDQRVREALDAKRAERQQAYQIRLRHRLSMRNSFNRSAEP
jgi:hypothetical protein